jgi:hypothetical protein
MDKHVRELWERLKEAPREIGAELRQMGAHGCHELAAALFNGSAFVMYPRAQREKQQQVEDQQPGVSPEAQKQQEHDGMER